MWMWVYRITFCKHTFTVSNVFLVFDHLANLESQNKLPCRRIWGCKFMDCSCQSFCFSIWTHYVSVHCWTMIFSFSVGGFNAQMWLLRLYRENKEAQLWELTSGLLNPGVQDWTRTPTCTVPLHKSIIKIPNTNPTPFLHECLRDQWLL